MAREPVKEDPPIGAPAWMLTFCDCMTLLLTFFVLLLSFSSFDESSQRRLQGAMQFRSSPPTINNSNTRIDDSVAIQVTPIQDVTDKGAEKKRPPADQKVVKNPKKAVIRPETDAYNQETVLSIALDELFMGDSNVLTSRGRDGLNKVASFLKLMPYYAIIGESSPHRVSSRSVDRVDAGLQRSWIVLQFLKDRQNFRPGRFWISGECPRPRYSKKNKPTMQIVLLGRDVTRASNNGNS